MKEELVRSSSDKMLAGVCGGVARSFGIDPTLTRILWAVVTLFTGIPIAVYIVLWLVLPIDGGGTGFEDLKRAFGAGKSNPS
jgi:phage shock protein C